MRLLNFLKTRISSLMPAPADDVGAQDLGDGIRGDIYLVLVRDRAVRRQAAEIRRVDRHRDAGWPFIR